MLSELTSLEATYGEERTRDVIRAIHYLLHHQFVYAGDRGAATVYNTVTDSRFIRFIRDYFDAAGYKVMENGTEQWVGILPSTDEVPFPRMTIDETIALLVLALFWQEEINAGNVEERATVVSTVNTLYDHYEDVVARRRKTAVPIKQFVEILEAFKLRNIIRLKPLDQEEQDRELVIRPQVRVLAGDDLLERIERFARDEEVKTEDAVKPAHGHDAKDLGDAADEIERAIDGAASP